MPREGTEALIEGEIPAEIARDTEVASAITTHKGDASAHHARYTNAEAQAIADAQILTHKGDASAHHTKYTDAEALAAAKAGAGTDAGDLVQLDASAKLPPVDGSQLTGIAVSYDIFDKFREFIPWITLDGFAIGGDTGYTIAVKGSYLQLEAAKTANYDAFISATANWDLLLDSGKKITLEFIILYLSSVDNLNMWLRMGNPVNDPPSETVHHFGWKLIGGATLCDLYASNATSTTQTITDTGVDIAEGGQRTRLKIILTPGTNCEFYVNDVLKVTHTTNLPTTNAYFLHLHIRTLEATGKSTFIGRVLIEKEHV